MNVTSPVSLDGTRLNMYNDRHSVDSNVNGLAELLNLELIGRIETRIGKEVV